MNSGTSHWTISLRTLVVASQIESKSTQDSICFGDKLTQRLKLIQTMRRGLGTRRSPEESDQRQSSFLVLFAFEVGATTKSGSHTIQCFGKAQTNSQPALDRQDVHTARSTQPRSYWISSKIESFGKGGPFGFGWKSRSEGWGLKDLGIFQIAS